MKNPYINCEGCPRDKEGCFRCIYDLDYEPYVDKKEKVNQKNMININWNELPEDVIGVMLQGEQISQSVWFIKQTKNSHTRILTQCVEHSLSWENMIAMTTSMESNYIYWRPKSKSEIEVLKDRIAKLEEENRNLKAEGGNVMKNEMTDAELKEWLMQPIPCKSNGCKEVITGNLIINEDGSESVYHRCSSCNYQRSTPIKHAQGNFPLSTEVGWVCWPEVWNPVTRKAEIPESLKG